VNRCKILWRNSRGEREPVVANEEMTQLWHTVIFVVLIIVFSRQTCRPQNVGNNRPHSRTLLVMQPSNTLTMSLGLCDVICPVRAPGRNAPLIRFLILVLCILFACLYCMLPSHLSFSPLFPYLSFSLRIDPLRFQAGCYKRQLNLALFFVFILCCRAFLLIGECMLLLC